MPHTKGSPDRVIHPDFGSGTGTDVDVNNWPTDFPDAAAQQSLDVIETKFTPSDGSPATVSAIGDTTVHTPAIGQRIRLLWVGLSTPESNGAEVLVKVLIGSTELYRWNMGKPGAFAHSMIREGAINEPLKVNLSASQTVYVNFDLEEI